MANDSNKTAWICLALAALVLSVSLLAIPWLARWRESTVYHALYSSTAPAFWWPSGWRREFHTSVLLEGQVWVRESEVPSTEGRDRRHDRGGKLASAGIVELVPKNQGRVFRTNVTNGRYSFNPQRLPATAFKVRFVSPDGSPTRWLQMGALDPGLHRIHWSF
jgi:hypothetical protein